MVPLGDETQVELVLVLLDIVLILTQDRCMVCVDHTICLKIILDAPYGTLRWPRSCGISLLSPWGQCYCWCKIGAWFAPNVPSAQKSFWTHLMVPTRWWGSRESSVRLEIVLIFLWDRCMVCVEHTMGLEIILDSPDGTLKWCGSCGISLLSVWRQC
jgi:hypothetical protein